MNGKIKKLQTIPLLFFFCILCLQTLNAFVRSADSKPVILLQWLDLSGQVLELSWNTEGSWGWIREDKNLIPVYHVRIEVPSDFAIKNAEKKAHISKGKNAQWIEMEMTSPLATIPLTRSLPPMKEVSGALSVRASFTTPVLLLHNSCEGHPLTIRNVQGEASFFFLGVRCDSEEGKIRLVLWPSEDAGWVNAAGKVIGEGNAPYVVSPFSESILHLMSKNDSRTLTFEVGTAPERRQSPVSSDGSRFKGEAGISAGEIWGDSPLANLHEFNLFAQMGAGYKISSPLYLDAKALIGMGSIAFPSSSYLQSEVLLGYHFMPFSSDSNSTLAFSLGLNYFSFKNEEVTLEQVSFSGWKVGLLLQGKVPWQTLEALSRFEVSLGISPLNPGFNPFVMEKVQVESTLSIPLFLRDSKFPWLMHLRLNHLTDSLSPDLSLTALTLGLMTKL